MDEIGEVMRELEREAKRARRLLSLPHPPSRRGFLEEGIRGLERACEEVRGVLEEVMVEAREACRIARREAPQVAQILSFVGISRERPESLVEAARMLAENLGEEASEALRKALSAQRAVSRVRVQLAEAALNLSSVDLFPTQERLAQEILARFFGVRPKDIAYLREDDLPYGDIAMLLAAVKKGGMDPQEAEELRVPGESFVPQLQRMGVDLDNFGLLLRFLRHEWEEEFGAGQ